MNHNDIDVYQPAKEKYFYRLLITTYQFDLSCMPLPTTHVLGLYADEASLDFDYYDAKVEPGQTILDSISHALQFDFKLAISLNVIAVKDYGYARDATGVERPKFIVILESDNFSTQHVKPCGWVTQWVEQEASPTMSKDEREQMIESFGTSYIQIAHEHAAAELTETLEPNTGAKITKVVNTLTTNRVLLRNDRHVAMLGSYFGNTLVKSGFGKWVEDADAPFIWRIRHISGSNFKPFELIDELIYGDRESHQVFEEAVGRLPQLLAMTPRVDMRSPASKVLDGEKVHYQEFFVNLPAAEGMPDEERVNVVKRSGYDIDRRLCNPNKNIVTFLLQKSSGISPFSFFTV